MDPLYKANLSDWYLECFPGSPTTTRPGIGGDVSMTTPFDVAEVQRRAPLQAITVV